MSLAALAAFAEVWLVDFEFGQPDGETPTVKCMVGHELRSRRTIRLFREDIERLSESPISTESHVLFVAYYASAEIGCYRSLGWPLPARVLDLYAEFRCLTSGLGSAQGYNLLGAMCYYGLPSIDACEKESMRQLAMRDGPYTEDERRALLEYCQSDVMALAQLLPKMLPHIDLPRALLRGRYMIAAAAMEATGIPIDTETHSALRANWGAVQQQLIERIDEAYGVYEGRTFKADRFQNYLVRNNIAWPHTDQGNLKLDEDTFGDMAKCHPELQNLKQLRKSLAEMRKLSLAVGADGRNRCLLSAFGSKTGRNQPSSAKFVFGPSAWFRGLIKPKRGRAIAYIDWEQQEFGIAAALSNDPAMMAAYASGDPYLEFAKQAGAAPPNATKDSHTAIREQFKVCAIAVQYGMTEQSLAARLGVPVARARQLLELHRQTYRRFWEWSQSVVDHAMLHGWLQTVFGWRVHVGAQGNPRSLANFPMQANGAEMLRLACCLATENGIAVCCPVHDALLIEADADHIETEAARCQAYMREASEVVLNGFPLRSDCKIVTYPDRYMDPRGEAFWNTVMGLIEQHVAVAA